MKTHLRIRLSVSKWANKYKKLNFSLRNWWKCHMIASASAWRSTTLTCLLYLWWVVCMVRKKRGKETEREGERGRERNFFIAFDDIKRHISISKRIQLICRFSLECWKFLGIGRRIRTKINEFSSMKWTRKNGSISSTVETTNEKPRTTLFRRETINDCVTYATCIWLILT